MNIIPKKIIFFYFILFILNLILVFADKISKGYPKESWNITEWLINYQAGFVRRGLLGEVILNIYKYTGISPYAAILYICIIVYIVFILFYIIAFISKGYPVIILPFVYFLGGPIINDFLVRKDVLVVLIFILVIYFINNKKFINIVISNMLLITGLLIHEMIGFFGFPIIILLLSNNNIGRYKRISNIELKSVLISIIQICPSLTIFCMCLYYKGSTAIANIIWSSWKPIRFPIQTENYNSAPAAIGGLSWSLNNGLSLGVDTLCNFNDYVYAPLAWFLIIIAIYYTLTNTGKLNKIITAEITNQINDNHLSNILNTQFISILPLFILGWDYGRWVFIWVTTSFAILILIPSEKLSTLFPDIITNTSNYINKVLDRLLGNSHRIPLLTALFIGVPGCSWSLDLYSITTSSYIIYNNITKLVHLLLTIIKPHFAGIFIPFS